MKKRDENDGRELLSGIASTSLSKIREVIYSGKTLKEKKKKQNDDLKKRLDENNVVK